MPQAKRTLVKSGPELWAEVSDPEALGGHLAAFGPIRITRTADASLVEWEGERAAGRLELVPAGFGTRVEIEARVTQLELPAPAAPEPEPAPTRGWWARRFRREPVPEVPATARPVLFPAVEDDEALRVLTTTLDALGGARHRPFSRS